MMNAFEMITLSQGLDLSALFDRQQEFVKRQTRFVSRKPAKTIVATIEVVAESMGFKVHSQNYKLRLEGTSYNRMSQFAVVLEIFEVAPSLFMVDVRKVAGDTLEYHRVCSVCISSFILIILLGTVSPNEIYFSQPRPKGPSSLDPIDGQDHPRGLYLALSSNIDRFMNAHV